jgi:hypothetical protein
MPDYTSPDNYHDGYRRPRYRGSRQKEAEVPRFCVHIHKDGVLLTVLRCPRDIPNNLSRIWAAQTYKDQRARGADAEVLSEYESDRRIAKTKETT